MPDDQDYQEFFRKLAEPLSWSDRQAASMRSTLENQKRAVDAAHPLDHKRRRQLVAVVEQIDDALRQWEERQQAPTDEP